MSPMKDDVEQAQGDNANVSHPQLLSKFQINDPDTRQGKISGIDITLDDKILVTDSLDRSIVIYDQNGQCLFTKTFDHNIWDCSCLQNGYFAVLMDDGIRVFTDKWVFCQKIRVSLQKPRQLTADNDGFFIVADADCKTLEIYHAKTGSMLSHFMTSGTPAGYTVSCPTKDSPRRPSCFISQEKPEHTPCTAMGTGVTVNSKDLIYIADTCKNSIRVFSHYGVEKRECNLPSNTRFQISKPLGLCVGSNDSIVVADTDNDRVLKFSADWKECVMVLDKVDGMEKPVAVAVTSGKNLVIVDSETNTYVVKCD